MAASKEKYQDQGRKCLNDHKQAIRRAKASREMRDHYRVEEQTTKQLFTNATRNQHHFIKVEIRPFVTQVGISRGNITTMSQ